MNRPLRLALFIVALSVVAIVAWRVYERDPEHLAGTPWICIRPVQAPHTEWLYVGKTPIPMTTYVDECAAWGKK